VNGDGWALFGAFAVAAPLIQSAGRLRCLTQGCCHGRVCAAANGIRYRQPLSRVVKLANLLDVPVYPTQLYSILCNLFLFGLLARLWFEGADCACIGGVYLILSTCARFVEEGYRGEPQTLVRGGLSIYQWLSIGCLLAGMVLLACPSVAAPQWSGWNPVALLYSLPLGLIACMAMGVDFPESSRKMSRLA